VIFMNDGRWVAFCDTPDCDSAERLWPDGEIRFKDGHKYGITLQGVLHCGNCGLTSQVDFPEKMGEVEAVLAQRPVPQTRNWRPGESVADLKRENLMCGVKT
jgi:hypothetical protein